MNHLHLSSFATERDLRLAIIETGRICYSTGLMHANIGNISMRLGADQVVVTPSRLCKGRLETDDLMVIDLNGVILKPDFHRKHRHSSEAALHLEIYRQRPEVRAVIHAHPSNATALTVAGVQFPVDVLPEVLEGLGPVPTTRFAMPTAEDSAQAIREFVKDHNAILIRNHGAITYGEDLDQALNYMEQLECVSKTVIAAQMLGKVNQLPQEIVAQLMEQYLKRR